MIAIAVILPILLGWGVMEVAGVFDETDTSDGADNGTDTPVEDEVNEISMGPAANDVTGTNQDDLIKTFRGNDTVSGGVGSDTIYGGIGKDVLNGGVGQDMIEGNWGDDEINGEVFADYLGGGDGEDTITGGYGDDVIVGNNGDDNIQGNIGKDVIYGGGGSDEISGGKGNDTLSGAFIELTPDASQEGYIDTTAEYLAAIAKANNALPSDATEEELLGTGFFDTLSPLNVAEADGSDTLYAGEGDDVLYIGATDVAKGGMGDDTFILTETVPDQQATVVDFSEGDKVEVYVPEGSDAPVLTIEVSGKDAILNSDGEPIGTFKDAADVLTLDHVTILGSTSTDTATTETDTTDTATTETDTTDTATTETDTTDTATTEIDTADTATTETDTTDTATTETETTDTTTAETDTADTETETTDPTTTETDAAEAVVTA